MYRVAIYFVYRTLVKKTISIITCDTATVEVESKSKVLVFFSSTIVVILVMQHYRETRNNDQKRDDRAC